MPNISTSGVGVRKKKVQITLDEKIHEQMKKSAGECGLSLSAFVAMLYRDYRIKIGK